MKADSLFVPAKHLTMACRSQQGIRHDLQPPMEGPKKQVALRGWARPARGHLEDVLVSTLWYPKQRRDLPGKGWLCIVGVCQCLPDPLLQIAQSRWIRRTQLHVRAVYRPVFAVHLACAHRPSDDTTCSHDPRKSVVCHSLGLRGHRNTRDLCYIDDSRRLQGRGSCG